MGVIVQKQMKVRGSLTWDVVDQGAAQSSPPTPSPHQGIHCLCAKTGTFSSGLSSGLHLFLKGKDCSCSSFPPRMFRGLGRGYLQNEFGNSSHPNVYVP